MEDKSEIALEICDNYLRCSKFKELARNCTLWSSPRLSLERRDPYYVVDLLRTMCRMEMIKSFSLNCDMTEPVDTILTEIKIQCPDLRKLVLCGHTVKDLSCVSELILRSRKLEVLILEDARTLEVGNPVMVLKNDLQSVRKLYIIDCGYRLTMYILLLFRNRKGLESLSIEVNPHYESHVKELLSLNAASLKQLFVKGTITRNLGCIICDCVELESLSLIADDGVVEKKNYPDGAQYLDPAVPSKTPNSADWLYYPMNFPSLKYLELEGFGTLLDPALIRITKSSPELASFSIGFCDKITNKSIEKILLKSQLITLELNEMSAVNYLGLVAFMNENKITSVQLLTSGLGLMPNKFSNFMKIGSLKMYSLILLSPLVLLLGYRYK